MKRLLAILALFALFGAFIALGVLLATRCLRLDGLGAAALGSAACPFAQPHPFHRRETEHGPNQPRT